MYYYRNRFYDSERGRFVQVDPIGVFGDLSELGNPYGGFGYNWVAFIDPYGLSDKKESEKGLPEWKRRLLNDPELAHPNFKAIIRSAESEKEAIEGIERFATINYMTKTKDLMTVKDWMEKSKPSEEEIKAVEKWLDEVRKKEEKGRLINAYIIAAEKTREFQKAYTKLMAEEAVYIIVFAGAGEIRHIKKLKYLKKTEKVKARYVSKLTRKVKPVSLPSWRKIKIDIKHIISGHTVGGIRVSSKKTLFPSNMTQYEIEKIIKEAYRYSKRIRSQGNRVLLIGESRGIKIEMRLNIATKTIETAYPVRW